MKSARRGNTGERGALLADAGVHVRRAYFECRFGQLHTRTAFPASGGFDERTTLLCLHPEGAGSRVFDRFLPQMAHDRSAYAPDLPGCGESDAPPQPCAIADYAASMADFAAGMRFGRLDVLGYGCGGFVAAELALAQPQMIRKLVLVAPALIRVDERAAENAEALNAAGMPEAPAASWYATAAREYLASERLPLLRQPALLVRTRDETAEQRARVRQYPRNVQTADIPDRSEQLFGPAPQALAQLVRQFLSAT